MLPALPLGLAACAGALYAWALAPGAPAALAWVALVPLFTACALARPALAALCGVVYAVVATALLADWFPGMLQRFFGASEAGSWLGWLGLMLLVNAPAYALLCGWLAWRGARAPVAPLGVGAAWLLAEWLRASAGPVPNPYALLATSQVGTAFAQSADALGALGVGAIVAAGNAALAWLLLARLRGARPLRPVALALGAILLAYGYGTWRGSLEYADPDAAPVRVAVVQPASGSEEARAHALAQLLSLTEDARAASPRLVFWPESSVDFYVREASPARERVLALTRALGATELVLGGPHYRYAEPEPDHFASAFLVRDGRIAGRYDKRRLVPFAEYDPLGGWLPVAARLRPGDSARPLPARDASVGAFLCGEVLFPEVARALARAGATVLSNPSNDDWFGADAPARHQLRAAALRAIENRRPLVRAATGGYSAVLDARGHAVAVSERGASTVLAADVQPSTARTPFQRAGVALAPCAAGLVLAASLPRRRPRPSGGTRP
jgi:apolipoprotein N-acyltransferase